MNYRSTLWKRCVRHQLTSLKSHLNVFGAKIFSWLHPKDLLNLARTNKAFRQFLLTKSSACFWRNARENVPGLLPCPSFLSEPAYANVVFSVYCSVSNLVYRLSQTHVDSNFA